MTMDEHKEIVGRLQNMTNIHSNVKESLQVCKIKKFTVHQITHLLYSYFILSVKTFV